MGSGELDILHLFMNDLKDCNLNEEQEKNLLIKAQAGDKKARDDLVMAHIGLVIKATNKYRGLGIDLLDLIQEGSVGLIKAIEKFDLSKRVRFSTLATVSINRIVLRMIDEKARLIRIPVNRSQEIRKLKAAQIELEKELMRFPTDEELSLRTEFSIEKIQTIRDLPAANVSFDNFYQYDLLEKTMSIRQDVENEVVLKILKEDLIKSFSELTFDEQQVLWLKYGFKDDDRYSERRLAKEMDTNRHKIRRIEKQAVNKLQRDLLGSPVKR